VLDGILPKHMLGDGGSILAILFVSLGVALLCGSVWLLLSTNVGGKRALQLTGAILLSYLFINALVWMVAGNGPLLGEGAGYWERRLMGGMIGLVSLVLLGVLLIVSHQNERAQQRVEKES